MQSYTVIGIVQLLSGGEHPIMQTVRAESRTKAMEAVLASLGGFAHWHTPELVRVLKPGHA